ncbi:alpha/beta hydrolase [Flagellimonas meridianipacifica]|uniref:Putative esterase n=1 Tax=Flagellimonas meridianipacifica TaxID=1080225 RepID=A0A2T0MCG0_9FLAO|nr:esterase [Allomuricauda pacifica]PRX55179.1 putative esterase [Allomuricauda pacifica]
MSIQEKNVTYTTQNTYATLNQLNENTKYVWLVFHGIGYLSRYFLKHFNGLNPEEHYVVAPQAPSKYYLKNEYKYVGASWLTKENTLTETENVMSYLEQVFKSENILDHPNLIVFGFSQGVSIALRWMVRNQVQPSALALYAGGIPKELKSEDFGYLDYSKVKIKSIYGDKDEFLNPERLKMEKEKLNALFRGNFELISFDGGHEIVLGIIENMI